MSLKCTLEGQVHTAIFNMDNQQGPIVYSTGNSAQRYVQGWEGVWGRMDKYIYMAESLCYSSETTTSLLISYTPMQNKQLKKKERKKWPVWFYRSKPKDLQWIELTHHHRFLDFHRYLFFFFFAHSLQTSACSPTPHLQVTNS